MSIPSAWSAHCPPDNTFSAQGDEYRQVDPFRPEKVLYDFDGPRTFTVLDSSGGLHLAHWCDEDENVVRYLIVPTSPDCVERQESGRLPLREALEKATGILLDVDVEDKT